MSTAPQRALEERVIGFFYDDEENLVCQVRDKAVQVTDELVKEIIGDNPLQDGELSLTEENKQAILKVTSRNGLTQQEPLAEKLYGLPVHNALHSTEEFFHNNPEYSTRQFLSTISFARPRGTVHRRT